MIASLSKQSTSDASLPTSLSSMASPSPKVSSLPSSLPPFKLEDELAKIEAQFCDSQVAAPPPQKSDHSTEQATVAKASSSSRDSNESEGKRLLPSVLIYGPDGKHLKPLQLTFAQFMLGNFKILESIMSRSDRLHQLSQVFGH